MITEKFSKSLLRYCADFHDEIDYSYDQFDYCVELLDDIDYCVEDINYCLQLHDDINCCVQFTSFRFYPLLFNGFNDPVVSSPLLCAVHTCGLCHTAVVVTVTVSVSSSLSVTVTFTVTIHW